MWVLDLPSADRVAGTMTQTGRGSGLGGGGLAWSLRSRLGAWFTLQPVDLALGDSQTVPNLLNTCDQAGMDELPQTLSRQVDLCSRLSKPYQLVISHERRVYPVQFIVYRQTACNTPNDLVSL